MNKFVELNQKEIATISGADFLGNTCNIAAAAFVVTTVFMTGYITRAGLLSNETIKGFDAMIGRYIKRTGEFLVKTGSEMDKKNGK